MMLKKVLKHPKLILAVSIVITVLLAIPLSTDRKSVV